jgi:hypothetical protein
MIRKVLLNPFFKQAMGVVVRRKGRLGKGWVRLVLLGCRQSGS